MIIDQSVNVRACSIANQCQIKENQKEDLSASLIV